ncbi:MAG TPA: response regulator [Sandaracinaceae bacterium LLY-WYZ-13_1]|nr:response regulator [Sandaracinaceae bacterium LLY-WYZ-13_1]
MTPALAPPPLARPTPRPAGERDDGPDEGEASEALRVLLVEDSAGDALLVQEWLARSGQPHRLWHRQRVRDAVSTLATTTIDVVLLDLSLPDARELEGVAAVRSVAPDVPLVVLTGRNDEAIAKACVTAGAHDYLEKDSVDPASLRRSIALARARAAEIRARSRLFHADRLQTVGQLAAGVAHEVNNPLQFVSANVSVANEALAELGAALGDADPRVAALLREAREALDDAGKGAERIGSVVRTLSQFSRAEDASVSEMDLTAVVRDACDMVAHRVRRCAELELELSPVPAFVGRRARLVQVLVNLLVNAAQAVEEAERTRGRVRVATRVRDGNLEIEVSDDGIGMSEATRRRIFDPFFTTKGRGVGTGLGLAVSHDIVADHGGSLTVRSRRGKGSRFVVRLPAASAAVPSSPAPARAASEGETARMRILVIDDEPLVLRSLRRVLRAHDLTLANGGREGLEVLEASTDFDAVVCDLSMPELGGRDLHRAARRLDPELAERFVFVTGGALTPEDRVFAKEHEAFEKPVDRHGLRARLAEIGPRRPGD